MYCELGGDVCGEIDALGTRERGCMYCEWGRGVCEEIDALGTRG